MKQTEKSKKLAEIFIKKDLARKNSSGIVSKMFVMVY